MCSPSPAEAARELLRRDSEASIVIRRTCVETGELIAETRCFRDGSWRREWPDGQVEEGRRVNNVPNPSLAAT